MCPTQQAEKDNEQKKRLEAQSSEKQAESPSPRKKEAAGHKVGQQTIDPYQLNPPQSLHSMQPVVKGGGVLSFCSFPYD